MDVEVNQVKPVFYGWKRSISKHKLRFFREAEFESKIGQFFHSVLYRIDAHCSKGRFIDGITWVEKERGWQDSSPVTLKKVFQNSEFF